MAKLHELLAAEKTPTAAWHELFESTLQKFKNPQHYYEGHSKSLSMIEETDANKATENQAREEKPVTTTVYDTLEYALDIYARAEDLQWQKNATNREAVGTVYWQGNPLLIDMPVDELLGLEARLTKLRQLFLQIPTLDATKHWEPDVNTGNHVWRIRHVEVTTKTEKVTLPVIMHGATKEHPAQVAAVNRDLVVGQFKTLKRSGAATTLQKAESLKRIDSLLIEIKQARMRANETEVTGGGIAAKITALLLEPLRVSQEDHQ